MGKRNLKRPPRHKSNMIRLLKVGCNVSADRVGSFGLLEVSLLCGILWAFGLH